MPETPYATDVLAALHDEDRWAEVPPQPVHVAALRPTQPAVTFDRLRHLIGGGVPETGDPYLHVVAHRGEFYVHDGHHRYLIALAREEAFVMARVVDEDRVYSPGQAEAP